MTLAGTLLCEVRGVGPDLLAAQGGWWYRGEYRLAPDPAGTLLVHQVRLLDGR
ncbi:hypothetical protein [Microbispora bryophytorum]|uniref:hypothetical protein n=1 Tax=Microbispora bryophytorum TaxID=1460882 RepID=UPI0037147AF7